jgi:hypothetical protein
MALLQIFWIGFNDKRLTQILQISTNLKDVILHESIIKHMKFV